MIRPGVWQRELTVPLQSIQAELNRLFDEYWRPPGEPADVATGPRPRRAPAAAPEAETKTAAESEAEAGAWTPAIDLWDSPTELVLVIDLPGVDPATIDLSLAGNVLSIKGSKPPGGRQEGAPAARSRVKERPTGVFHREVTLVEEVDFDRVEAQAKDGILTVRLPKRGAAVARTISIQPASQ